MTHPDEDTLLDYAMGHLSDEQVREVQAHMLSCQDCSEIIYGHLDALVAFAELYEPVPSLPGWEEETRAWLFPPLREQAWSPQLQRRLRVLLHAAPLLGLQKWDALRDPSTRHYDAVALAMRVFDCIIEFTGLGRDADSATVARALEPLLHQMDLAAGVEPDASRHTQFSEALLGRLRNDEHARSPFKLEYTDFVGGRAVRRLLELRLVEEQFASDDHVVLKLSPEAVNLFMYSLDLEIEDAQAALEAVITSQLERGRFDEAAQAARDARFRSVQFEEKIEGILRETRRDVTRVDWREAVPKFLRESLDHIGARLKIEKHISDTARERLESLVTGSREAGRVALITELMDDCFDRHMRLHDLLLRAHSVFFAEQDRQAFIPRPAVKLPNLFADVLEPLLGAPRPQALEVLTGAEGAMFAPFGARAPAVFSLEDFVSWCLRPRQEAPRVSVMADAQTWFESVGDALRYPSEVREAAEHYLPGAPTRLSTLLVEASHAGESRAVLEHLSLSALQAFEWEQRAGLRAERAEAPFAEAGFYGDDLELHPTLPKEENSEPAHDRPVRRGALDPMGVAARGEPDAE